MRRPQSRLLDIFSFHGRAQATRRWFTFFARFNSFFFAFPHFLGYIYLARLFDSNCGVEAIIE